jgi:hypothetical protein
MENILLVVSNNKQYTTFTRITVTEGLNNSNLYKLNSCNDDFLCSQCSHGEFSTLRPETEY